MHRRLEPYHSERVLRQFGRVQIVPPSPLIPENIRRRYTTINIMLATHGVIVFGRDGSLMYYRERKGACR